MSHTSRFSRAGAGLFPLASLLLTMLLVATSWSAVAAQETEESELTWAPLETLQPIAEPPIWSPAELADGFALGQADAPVTIEVWEDFQCPFCQRFTFEIEPQVVEEFVETGKARLVFRNLAFLGDESHWAAVASSLAADQDLFWPFHDYLFANLQGENIGSYSLERLLAIGEASGLDMDEFRAGLVLDQARERFSEIQAESREDASALGISATPTVTVQGVPLQAPDFETIASSIEVALANVDGGEGAPETEDSTEVDSDEAASEDE